jgi:hypothetical protein
MKRVVALAALTSALTFTACDSFGQAMTSHTDVLARAAGHELTVEQATNILAPAARIPINPQVVDAIANLWIDYTLLATAAAEDTSLSNLKLDGVVTPFFNQQLVFQLREKVIKVDTMIDDAELRAMFDKEQPGGEVKARHVLFNMPTDATPQVRDSVMKLAAQVLQLAKAGGDFAQLAAKYSQEPGAAERGGDLGWFGPGAMVAPFEEAAFKLQKGQISDLVETPFGIHIIKVEDRRTQPFEQLKDQYLQQKKQQAVADAEEAYLKALTDANELKVEDGALEVARNLAQKPTTSLSGRASRRAIVSYKGGSLTAKEYLTIMQQRDEATRQNVAQASDDQLKEWLQLLARDELLITEAGKQDLKTPVAEMDSARMELRRQLKQAMTEAGLLPIVPAEGENMKQAAQRMVMAFITAIVNGERSVIPLNAISYELRDKYGAEVQEQAVPVVVSRVTERRPAQGPSVPMPMPMPQPTPPTSTGN